MKLLLHTCCAPCLIYPLEQLGLKGFQVEGFFYNPNIHPLSEYNNRRQALEDYSNSANINVIYPEYVPSEFFWEVNPVRSESPKATDASLMWTSNGVNLKESKPQRCSLCWRLRLRRTAEAAKEKGFNYFSTTLLVSPYQDQELLKEIGSAISKEEGVEFYYADFRTGFKRAHEEAHALGIYCQKYCGCIYSMKPRLTERSERKSYG